MSNQSTLQDLSYEGIKIIPFKKDANVPFKKDANDLQEYKPLLLDPNKKDSANSKVTSIQNESLLGFQDIKRHNREITSKSYLIKDEDKINRERQELVIKKFKQGLTSAEERKLKYLCWELDRIDDAKHGGELDQLDSIVKARQEIALMVEQFVQKVESVKPKQSKHSRGKKK